jgi:hypothetical protein
MEKHSPDKLTSRINLMVPLDMCIQIEKESEKRGIGRAQFVKEAIHEKLKKIDGIENELDLPAIKNDLKELRHLVISVLERLRTDNT